MQLDFISKELGFNAVPGMRLVKRKGEYGNAVMTRFPIAAIRRHDLSYSRREPRGAVDVELDVEGSKLRVIAAHLGLRRSERRFQWRRLMVAIAEASLEIPTVVLGDMKSGTCLRLPYAKLIKHLANRHRLLAFLRSRRFCA